MMLNHGEVCLKMIRQGVMTQRYPKKESIPSNLRGADFSHLEHVHVTSLLSLGIFSKKPLTLPNCVESSDSIKSANSFLVESFALNISSPSQIYSMELQIN